MSKGTPISSEVLVWARERAGISIEDAARKLQIPAGKLCEMEKGDKAPTSRQLSNMSSVYGCALGIFYMPAPPPEEDRMHDFRTKSVSSDKVAEGLLRRFIDQMETRQSIIKDVVTEDADGSPEKVSLVGEYPYRKGLSVDEVVHFIKRETGFDLNKFRSTKSKKEAFKYLRSVVEEAGVFVIQAGDLGSHHSKMSTDVFRGMALADTFAPMIVLNKNDSISAQSFTLLHELAHLVMDKSSISGALGTTDGEEEVFCDKVAAGILLPDGVTSLFQGVDTQSPDFPEIVSEQAKALKVSATMLAYNMMRENMIPQIQYRTVSDYFREKWEKIHQSKSEKKEDGGFNPIVLLRSYSGNKLLDLTRRSMQSGYLVPTKAALVIGTRAISVGKVVQ